jgi:hypothetical protein
LVGEEGGELAGGGWQAGEVEGESADEGGFGGFRGGGDVFAREAGVDEVIHGMGAGRNGMAFDGAEGPVVGGSAKARGAGPRSAVVDPGFEGGDLGGREAFADRGPGFSAVPFDAGDEFAGGGGAGLDDLEECFPGVQAEAGHLGFGAMAAQAAGCEDGGDLGGEIGRE